MFPVYPHGFQGSLRLVWLLSLSTMGKNCIALGCHKTHQKGFSLFKFPTNDKLRKAWTLEVQRTRDKWHGPVTKNLVPPKIRSGQTEHCRHIRSDPVTNGPHVVSITGGD